MNITAMLGIGVYLLEHGGPPIVGDAIALTKVIRDLQAGRIMPLAALTDANLDAIGRIMGVLVGAVKDPGVKAQILALVQS